MTDKTPEDRALDMLETLGTKIADALSGPGADAALLMYRAEAIDSIVSGLIWSAVLVALLIVAKKFTPFVMKAWEEEIDKGGFVFCSTLLGLLGTAITVLILCGAFNLIKPSNWIQIFYPEIGIVRDALGALK